MQYNTILSKPPLSTRQDLSGYQTDQLGRFNQFSKEERYRPAQSYDHDAFHGLQHDLHAPGLKRDELIMGGSMYNMNTYHGGLNDRLAADSSEKKLLEKVHELNLNSVNNMMGNLEKSEQILYGMIDDNKGRIHNIEQNMLTYNIMLQNLDQKIFEMDKKSGGKGGDTSQMSESRVEYEQRLINIEAQMKEMGSKEGNEAGSEVV